MRTERLRKRIEVLGGVTVLLIAAGTGVGFALSSGTSGAAEGQNPTMVTTPTTATPTATTAPAEQATCTQPIPGLDQITPGWQELDGTRAVLSSDFPDNYGGIYATSESAFTVVEVHRDPCLELAATAGFAGYTVSFRLATHGLTELEQVSDSIAANHSALTAKGITFEGTGLNTEANKVTVMIRNGDPGPAQSYLDARYGTNVIEVQPSMGPWVAD